MKDIDIERSFHPSSHQELPHDFSVNLPMTFTRILREWETGVFCSFFMLG